MGVIHIGSAGTQGLQQMAARAAGWASFAMKSALASLQLKAGSLCSCVSKQDACCAMHRRPSATFLCAPCVAHLSHISGLNAANALRMLDLMSLGGSLEILMQVCRMDSGTILACRQKQRQPFIQE